MSTILFENVNFLSGVTGATTKRTSAARWGDWRNVIDFGADPTGTNDCATAVSAALNANGTGTDAATIYFPLGTYKINSAINLNGNASGAPPPFGFIFCGEGYGSKINWGGVSAGFIFDRSRTGQPASQFGLMGFENLRIINSVAGGGGIRMDTAQTAYIHNCYINCDIGLVANDGSFFVNVHDCFFSSASNPVSVPTGSIGIDGNQMIVTGSQFTGFDMGIKSEGHLYVYGCRFEENNYGIQATNSLPATLVGIQCEANGVDVDLNGCNRVSIINLSGQGEASQESIDANSWSIAGLQFHGSNDQIAVINCGWTGSYTTACINTSILANPNTNVVFTNCKTSNAGAGPGGSTTRWVLPTNPSSWEFIHTDMNLGASGQAVAFANLPSPAYAGYKAWINNSNTNTFGATIAGGGANLVQGQYNGSNWTVVAA